MCIYITCLVGHWGIQLRYNIEPIGIIESPYREKFAIPRQPGLVKSAQGSIVMNKEFSSPDFFRGLDSFSHIWLEFVFHENIDRGWQPLIRPPRLGGNAKIGVFASRSTFRPNALGLSVVELLGIHYQRGIAHIDIGGLDLLHGTPIIDIKPYLPYADAIPEARGGYAHIAPEQHIQVEFSAAAKQALIALQQQYPNLNNFIVDVLKQDPRPAYQKKNESDRIYGMQLYNLNINWHVQGNTHYVTSIMELS